MGVYVKYMKMPKCCIECPCFYVIPQGYVFCGLNEMTGSRPYVMAYEEASTERLDNCPMVDVPVPHGSLIDRAKLFTVLEDPYQRKTAEMIVLEAQTVIEAEGE